MPTISEEEYAKLQRANKVVKAFDFTANFLVFALVVAVAGVVGWGLGWIAGGIAGEITDHSTVAPVSLYSAWGFLAGAVAAIILVGVIQSGGGHPHNEPRRRS